MDRGVHENNEVIRFRGENARRELVLENLTKFPSSNQQQYYSQSLEMLVIGHPTTPTNTRDDVPVIRIAGRSASELFGINSFIQAQGAAASR